MPKPKVRPRNTLARSLWDGSCSQRVIPPKKKPKGERKRKHKGKLGDV